MAPSTMILLFLSLSPLASATSADLGRDLSESLKVRPVMKVVRMLQDMGRELQAELEDDKAVHEQLACWCETNEKQKTAAIEAGKQKAAELEAFLGEAKAKILSLKETRKETLDGVYADTKSLGEATELRMKENQEFHGTETDLIEAIDAAKNAIVVLSAHHPSLEQVSAVARKLADLRVAELLAKSEHSMSSEKINVFRSFLQGAASADSSSFLSIPGYRSYAPQSGQIFGILKQMKEDFESTLSEEQAAELKAEEDYKMLKAAKEDQIAAGKAKIIDIDHQLAEYGEKYQEAAEDLQDTLKQLELDEEFLRNLKKKCSESEAEFDQRVKDRLEEIAAVEDTIKILNNDESFEAFDKMAAPQPMLLQIARRGGSSQKETRERAAILLQRTAHQVGSAPLALLAANVKLDEFTKVKELIDKMVVELEKQQADEIKHRDFCIKELNDNNRSMAAGYDKKNHLETDIEDLTKQIESLTEEIAASHKSIAEMQEQQKRASENREADNADFQQTVSDHRVMSIILEKALRRMKEVYAAMLQQQARDDPDGPGAAHIETSGNHTDPGNGPARFKKYEQHAGGARVVMALEQILADTRKVETQACETEIDAQTAYEDLMKGLNKAIRQTMEKIADLEVNLATSKEALGMAKSDLKATMHALEGLHQTNMDLHKACDYTLDNFEARQAARAAEVDALKEAKAILSGMQ